MPFTVPSEWRPQETVGQPHLCPPWGLAVTSSLYVPGCLCVPPLFQESGIFCGDDSGDPGPSPVPLPECS